MATITHPKTSTSLLLALLLLVSHGSVLVVEANWCVARSDASEKALQTALDYACGSGADCSPLQANGLCYLPNNIQAHASYAFNSYFQRKAMAPGSCDFSGTATVAQTDPSYGSCVYPATLSTAGGALTPPTTPTTSSTNPFTPMTPTTATPLSSDGSSGVNPGITSPTFTPPDNSEACSQAMVSVIVLVISCYIIVFLIL